MQARIVGGTEAAVNSYPCMGALVRNDGVLLGGCSISKTNTFFSPEFANFMRLNRFQFLAIQF